MKLPNGYGSVTKLSGNRRKPYLARVTLGWITDEQTGKTVQNRVPLGTFKTKKEALQALAEYGANPYDIQNAAMTLAELYDKWTAAYFPTLESESSCRTIKSAWSYCHAIAGMRVKDLRARHIKGIMAVSYTHLKSSLPESPKTYLLPGFHTRISHIREPVPAPVRSGILDGRGSYRILHTYSFCLQSSQNRRSVYRASEQIVLNLVLE